MAQLQEEVGSELTSDSNFEKELLAARWRRAERVSTLVRWVILVLVAINAHVTAGVLHSSPLGLDLTIAAWALFAGVWGEISRRWGRPSVVLAIGILAIDVAAATAIVGFSGSFLSPLLFAFIVALASAGARFGIQGGLLAALAITIANVAVGLLTNDVPPTHAMIAAYLHTALLFLVGGGLSGMLGDDDVAAREDTLLRIHSLENKAQVELGQVDRVKTQFVMLASHELRTPLHKIRSYLTLMHDRGSQIPDATKAQMLTSLYTQVEHLTRLNDNLLAIAQLETGEIRINMSSVDLMALIGNVLSRFTEAQRSGRFNVDIAQDAQWVRADQERLDLLLSCLVDNALGFSPKDSPIRIRTLRSGLGRVSIEVEDEGKRIPVDQVDRVFASFYQVENPIMRQRGGFGIGLYLARQLAEEMEGGIGLRNDKVHGNTFIVQLRNAPAIPDQAARPTR